MFPRQSLPDQIGPYKILRHLSSRGGADLFLGEQTGPMGFKRPCVMKLVPTASYNNDPRQAHGLAHEAAICSRLNHPAIVRMYDFFEHEGRLVLVFEHFGGISLGRLHAHFRRRHQTMPDSVVWFIAHNLFSAIAHAHSLTDESGAATPVVHRDIQPSHIIMSKDAQVRLAGFGIAKIAGTTGDTAVGFVKGTPSYMAPEQAGGDKVTERADVYACGLVVWELLSGRPVTPPVAQGPDTDLLKIISGRRVQSISSIRTDIPREIGAALDECLQMDPAKRTIRAEEVDRWLRKVVDVSAGRGELRSVLGQLRATPSMQPPPLSRPSGAAPAPKKSLEPRRMPARFPGLAARPTGRPSSSPPGELLPNGASARPKPLRGSMPSLPFFPPMGMPSNDGESEAQAPTSGGGYNDRPSTDSQPGADADGISTALFSDNADPGEGPVDGVRAHESPHAEGRDPNTVDPSELMVTAKRPLPQAKPDEAVLGSADVVGAARAPEGLVPDDTERVLWPIASVQIADQNPSVAPPAQGPVSVPHRPIIQAEADTLQDGELEDDSEPGDTTIMAQWRREQTRHRAALGVTLSFGFVVVVAAALVLRSATRANVAHTPVAPRPAESSTAVSSTVLASATSTATGPSADDVEPAGEQPSAPAEAVSAVVASPEIPNRRPLRGRGFLIVKSPPQGAVYINGVHYGPTDSVIESPCGRRFIRVGTPPGPRGSSETVWAASGHSIVINCGVTTETQASPPTGHRPRR